MDSLRRLLLSTCLLWAAGVQAQLSPGDLHKVHAFLEGVQNCDRCHGGDRELVSDKCLACHATVKEQRISGQGLHSKPNYQKCQDCHVEHQGRNFELIHWKTGEKSFDHTVVDFRLEGKHASLQCRQCHQSKFITRLVQGADERIDSTRTYLGLSRVCTSCHVDEHRGQLGDKCTTCHTQTAWKPASGFDHSKSSYELTGKHETVACIKCHSVLTDRPLNGDPDYLKYSGIAYNECSTCHADFHNGKLGTTCSSCHTTNGWQLVSADKFDHSKTRYPLEGMHSLVACNKCHQVGRPASGLAFGACRSCHADFHRGEFTHRTSGGQCEECHTVKGFSPANFLMSQHDQTRYPLLGAHRAIPCASCHKSETTPPDFRFIFASTRCFDCHKNPHHGELDSLIASGGCESCHGVESWQKITYDHSRTGFALDGKHSTVVCAKCHAGGRTAAMNVQVRFADAKKDCQGCHADIHRGQFASTESSTDCSRCHTPAKWKPSTFDHMTGSRFRLDGAHRTVACAKCHRVTGSGSEAFVQYKPLEKTCVSCHGTNDSGRSSSL